MRLSQAQLNAYNDALHVFQDGAVEYFRALMEGFRADNPGAGVAQCREFCIVAMEEALGIYAPAAQELAAQMFDYICEEEGIDARAELPAELYDREMLVDAAHYNAGKLVEDAVAGWVAFVDAEARLANFYVRRSAYEAMRESCRDGNVRWARVPTGRETCGYCFMLASRGFDYVDEDTARAGSHVGCDCIVVPGKQGRTEIEGYHPEELYERWKECEEAAESTKYTDVIKEVETRDWDWVWTGEEKSDKDVAPKEEPPSERIVTRTDKPREVDRSGISNKEWKRKPEYERAGYETLARDFGLDVVVLPEDSNIANIDMRLEGELWELKTITGSGGRLHTRISEGVSKWDRLHAAGEELSSTPKIMVDARSTGMSDKDVIKALKSAQEQYSESGFDEAGVICKDGTLVIVTVR